MRTITEIIIHCTATRPGQPCTIETIRRYHRSLSWSDIGYHYVIYPDGSIHTGRLVELPGAHTTGRNAHSVGIAYVGGLDSSGHPADTRTPNQRAALQQRGDAEILAGFVVGEPQMQRYEEYLLGESGIGIRGLSCTEKS